MQRPASRAGEAGQRHLITKAFDELKANSSVGRAEALRRSMLSLLGKSSSFAHPANWAPFVVVGEGAR
jgi:CHAT domain-containing protein